MMMICWTSVRRVFIAAAFSGHPRLVSCSQSLRGWHHNITDTTAQVNSQSESTGQGRKVIHCQASENIFLHEEVWIKHVEDRMKNIYDGLQ